MKKLLFVLGNLAAALSLHSQSSFSSSVRQFIDYNAAVTVLTHCRLVDVIHLRVVPDQTVIIRNGLIESVGDASKATIPADATVVDLTGKSLLPGFVLMHEHMYYTDYSLNPFYAQFKQLPVTFPKMYLACGATTIRTAGSLEPYSDLSLRRDIGLGKIAGPDMDVTGPYLEGKGTFSPQMHELSGPEEAKTFVNFWADQGATSFKAYNFLDRATLKAAIDAAHARGCKITGHLCSVTYREAAEMGIDQLEHGFLASTDFISGKKEDQCVGSADPLASADTSGQTVKDLIQLLVNHKVTLTSTLAVFQGICTLDTTLRPEMLAAMAPDTREMFLKYYNKNRSRSMNNSFLKDLRMEKMFADAGGLLTVGTDPTGTGSVLAGYGSQTAIELLVGEGFTPVEAIRIASYNGARAMGLEKKIGSIEAGKQADLVVIDGDVSLDIRQIRRVIWVFKKGVGFNSQKLFDNVKGQVGKY